jgi:Protein of unknown function (DUF2490)
MSLKKVLLGLSLFIQFSGFSQKQTTHVEQVWLAYCNQTRFSNKWGLWADLHLRTKEDFFTNFSTSIVRAGLTYYLNDNTKLTAGYAYVNHFPAEGHKNISQPEHRPWQQVQWHTKYQRVRLMQWVRLEERFRREIISDDELGDGYNFNWRVRYNFLTAIPLAKKAFAPGTWAFILNDELHVNAGKEIVYNYFDQNRFFIGFSYHLNAHDNIQFGYMNVFQQLAAGNQYKSIHAARIFYFHNLDLRTRMNAN